MTTLVLFLGLAALFMGVSAAIVLAGTIGRERSEISSSLASIEAIGGQSGKQGEKKYRCRQRQTHQPQIEGIARQRIDLPTDCHDYDIGGE